MVKDALHRYSIFVAASVLLLAVAPGVLTNISVACLSFVLALWLRRSGMKIWYPPLVIAAVALAGLAPRSPGLAQAVYSFAAHCSFAMTIALAVTSSRSWLKGPDIVEDGGVPSLRSLSAIAIAASVLQVAFGAAYRNDVAGLVPHVVGAIFVTMLLLVLAAFVLTQFPDHPDLKPAAWRLVALVPVQIGLGIMAYIGRANLSEKASLSSASPASTVSHVIVGAMTLAATVTLALRVFHNVRPKRAAAYQRALGVQ